MNRKQVLAQQAISAIVFVGIVTMLGWLSTRYKLEADWTAGHRNTLTEPSVKFLGTLKDPVKFLVFTYPRSENRQSLEADIARYQRIKPDVSVEFIDPTANPNKVKEYNVSHDGEVVAEYQGRRESLTATTEQAITTTLQRLSQAGERWVVFLEGHGEHGVTDTGQNGYSDFEQLLKDKGLKVRGLNLATDSKIPDNVSVLVLAGPAKGLLPGEAKLLDEYVGRGGNLLWLGDPAQGKLDPETSLDELSKSLGVNWLKGTGVLLESASLGLPPFVYITTRYPPNPVTHDFLENALFPLVRGMSAKAPEGWNLQPLLTTSDQAWLETGVLEGELSMDQKSGDTQGPLTLGVTLTREGKATAKTGANEPGAKAAAQRVAVIGDSDFLANAYVGQLGNGLLGLNLVQWLASRDDQLNIDIPKAPDRALEIQPWGMYAIYFGFAFLLPALLLGFGIARWIVRRRK